MTSARDVLITAGCSSITVGRAPGRVNIIGEHTDYNGGLVLPMAIHLGVTTAISPRHDNLIVMRSVQVPGEVVAVPLAELAPGSCTGWSAYVAGAVWALAGECALAHGFDIAIDGDVPLGAGLSSSAAVECSVLITLAAQVTPAQAIPARQLARLAQRAENEFVGVPTGSMDQVASMLGVDGHALLFDVRDDAIELVPVDVARAGAELLVIDTRASHELVDGGYADRRRTCEQAAALLGVSTLREVDDLDAALERLLTEPDGDRLMRRTRHVVSENARVMRAVGALRAGDLAGVGELMCASHASLRDDYEVSCPELDVAVDAAMSAGALGARMMGGGFGGSAIVLAPVGHREATMTAVARRYLIEGFGPAVLIPVSPAPGARLIG